MIQAKKSLLLVAAGLFAVVHGFSQAPATNAMAAKPDTTKKAPPTPSKPTVADKVKSSKKTDGLFTVYQDTANGSVQLYVRKSQLGKEYIYQSFSMGGPTSLFLHQNMIRTTWIFKIRKNFDKLEFAQANTNFWYDPSNAVSKAANVDVTEAVFYSAKIDGEDSLGFIVAGDALFLSEKLDPIKPIIAPGPAASFVFNLGSLNSTKSGYRSVRSYPNNTDVIVELAYDNPAPFNQGGKDITDARYNRIRFQHSFLEIPENDFHPRYDDPRVGYFTQEIDNLTSTKVADYKDVINRWNLKKKDPSAALSEPVEPIVWWVENTTPVEYRQTIVDAGLKWNEAFEKAGFKNAVVMKIMPDDAKWDPADIRYNVIRWVSSPYPPYGAIGPSFVNPRTGQILGADITVEWQTGSNKSLIEEELFDVKSMSKTDLPSLLLNQNKSEEINIPGVNKLMECTLGQGLKGQFTSGLTTLEATGAPDAEIRELHKQFLYFLILHEMGHTMGLNHNMKASQMLSPAEVNNTTITHSKGLQGSVMDYPVVNVTLDRSKQGDYYTVKTGPYDLWAIEFGYTPFKPDEEEEGLKKILDRSNEPSLCFGNDADIINSSGGIDPRVMVWDMSNDMVAYAEDRFMLVNNLMVKLRDKYSKPGKSYAELRSRYGNLMNQRFQMAQAVSRYIGGVMVDRSFVGQGSTTKPFTPVSAAYQKKAMSVLAKYVFAPDAFKGDASLFPYLQMQRRGFNFFGVGEDIKPQTTVLALQVNLFAQILSATNMTRMNNSSLYGNTYSVADMINDVTNAVFSADLKTNVNLYRLNLQTEYVKGLTAITTAPASPYDNASKAAMYNALKKIKGMLATAVSTDEQTRAHRANLAFLIEKALSVK